MSTDHLGLAAALVYREPDLCVMALSGHLSPSSAGLVTTALSKSLLDAGQVLVDMSELRLTSTPAVQVFSSALSATGGWPGARLVLFGADPRLAETLRAQQVSATVPLAADQLTARQLLQQRPPTVARHLDLEQELSSPRRARFFVATACRDWHLDAIRDDAVLVASELVDNAVVHAQTACRLALQLDARGLNITVRDYRSGLLNALRPAAGHGLVLVATVSRAWAISPTEDGKIVSALLPTTEQVPLNKRFI